MFPRGPVPAYCTVLSVYLAVLLLRLWHCYCWNAGLKDQRHYHVKTKKAVPIHTSCDAVLSLLFPFRCSRLMPGTVCTPITRPSGTAAMASRWCWGGGGGGADTMLSTPPMEAPITWLTGSRGTRVAWPVGAAETETGVATIAGSDFKSGSGC